jgi:predicted N-acyltransferase
MIDRAQPHFGLPRFAAGPCGRVVILSRADLANCSHWQNAFARERKDRRFYELVEDTIQTGFAYGYLAIQDREGIVQAVQPFFILEQDLLAGIDFKIRRAIGFLQRLWPRLLYMRTMMIGCAVGEGHLDGDDESHKENASLLASAALTHARNLSVSLVVLKEFPARYRETLQCFLDYAFVRVPSLPMTRLNIDYPSFDAYVASALSGATRRKLRKKFRAASASAPIALSVVHDITPAIEEAYPLYLQVYSRSKLHFEKLTKAFFCALGQLMPNKVRFFLWRQNKRIVAFTLCMVNGDAFYAEYIGLDYSVALDLHLYHYTVRDMISWAIAHRYKWFRSSGLNYDPKLHLRHRLDPVDLYVRHTSPIVNAILKRILPLIEPTRFDPVLKLFPNYSELWG